MICKNCGSEIDDNAWECPHCLIDITPEQRQEALDAKKRQEMGEGPAQVQYAPPPPAQYAPPPQVRQQAPPPMQQQYGPAPQQRTQYAPPPQPARTQYAPPPTMQQGSLPREVPSARQEPVHTFETPSFYQPPTSFEEDKVEVPIVIGSILVPIWGLVMGINNLQKGKNHSGKVYLLIWGLIRLLPVALILLFFLFMGLLFG